MNANKPLLASGRRLRAGGTLALILLALPPETASGQSAHLTQGEPVDVEIGPGEIRNFEIDLEAGKPRLLAVEQLEVDVTVTVRTASGTVIAAVDSPFDRRGTERLVLESNDHTTAGRVEIEVRDPGAPPGIFRILLTQLDPEETTRLAAARATAAAGEAYLAGGTDNRRKALKHYRRALTHWRALSDRAREVETLHATAVLARLVDDDAALDIARMASSRWRELGESFWQARAWNEIGLNLRARGEMASAREAFERSHTLHRANGETWGEAVALANLCFMHLPAGELRAGVACYEQALPLLTAARAPAISAAAGVNAGAAWEMLGEPDRAVDNYRQAQEWATAAGDREIEARISNNLGVLASRQGQTEDALESFDRALALFGEVQDQRGRARALNNLGAEYLKLADTGSAKPRFEQALALWREADDARGQATALFNLGTVHDRLAEPWAALPLYRKALEVRRQTGDRREQAFALSRIARALVTIGDLQAARDPFDHALELLRQIGDRPAEAVVLVHRAELSLAAGEPDKARERLTRALELAREVRHPPAEALALEALARTERQLGHRKAAQRHTHDAITVIENLRSRIHHPDLRASYLGASHRAYELAIDLEMEAHAAEPDAGHDRTALQASERARARVLLDLLAEAGADVREGIDPALAERRAALLRRLSARTDRALRAAGEEKATLEGEKLSLLRELDRVEIEIRRRSPAYAELIRPTTANAAEIQALLEADTLLLSFALGETRSFLWAVSRDRIEVFELPGRRRIETAARSLHSKFAAFDPRERSEQSRAAAELSTMLLGPIAARLDGAPDGMRLAVVPDGALYYLPFSALPVPSDPRTDTESAGPPEILLERHEIVYLPSASALAVQRQALINRPPAPRPVVVVADPVFDPWDSRVSRDATKSSASTAGPVGKRSLERLPATRHEAEIITSLAPIGENLAILDFEANRSRILDGDLDDFRVIHFATHGVIDTEQPALSGLALSQVDTNGRHRNGSLLVPDLYNLRLGADLVVLSGCRTALGKEVRGEGLLGLVRGFTYAGAPRVLASLWQVDDRATSFLMTAFYQALWRDGLSPAAALRQARLALRQERRWRDPAFWAAFVLIGDWH